MIDPDNTFFAADFHFDHTNIIRYCNRPFETAEEMNETMLRNYREVIKPSSLVYFVGDMAYGRGSHKPRWWLSQLDGKIIYIKGSHDRGIHPTDTPNCCYHLTLDTDIGSVLLIHDPSMIPDDWGQWVIHGHTHSTQMVDIMRKRVCVSVEATNYKPVSLRQIRDAIKALL